MQDQSNRQRTFLEVSRAELTLINNALYEVVNGIHMDEGEFQTRLGESVEDARGLLRRIQALLGR